MRRSHDALKPPTLSVEPTTGVRHRRHHVSADGYYRGHEIIADKTPADEAEEEEQAG